MSDHETETPETLHPYEGETPPFEAFLPFVHLTDEAARPDFTAALKELYDLTADTWRPGGCHSATYLEEAASKLQGSEQPQGVNTKVMTYGAGHHYFLEMTLPGEEDSLVVDPFGVPAVSETKYMANPRLITPFFGNIELAPPSHRKVYEEAQQGYRAPFRP